jgi:hypothetical protein
MSTIAVSHLISTLARLNTGASTHAEITGWRLFVHEYGCMEPLRRVPEPDKTAAGCLGGKLRA